MVTALICSAGMGLPVSGFPNMTAYVIQQPLAEMTLTCRITQENKLGQRFIGATDFLKNGIPASILATFVSLENMSRRTTLTVDYRYDRIRHHAGDKVSFHHVKIVPG